MGKQEWETNRKSENNVRQEQRENVNKGPQAEVCDRNKGMKEQWKKKLRTERRGVDK